MGAPPAKDWKQSVILALLTLMGVGGVGGGLPYITELQHKVDASREIIIRLEEKLNSQEQQMHTVVKTLDDRLKNLQEDIRDLKRKMEARGIVNRQASAQPIVGSDLVEGK